MLYAALEGSQVIRLPHLRAALSFVDYCDKSAARVFGSGSQGSPAGEPEEPFEEPNHAKLLNLIKSKPKGVIKRDAHALFGNHMPAPELDGLFTLLLKAGFIVEAGGRWYAAGCSTGFGGSTASNEPPNSAPANGANMRTCEHDTSFQKAAEPPLQQDVRSSHVRRFAEDENCKQVEQGSAFAGSQVRSSQPAALPSDDKQQSNQTPVIPSTAERGSL